MNVNKENFAQVVKEILPLLPTCSFMSFDEEMTGIHANGQREQLYDLPFQRYEKMSAVARTFSLLQFGICLYHQVESPDSNSNAKQHYIARPFNFYVFPNSKSSTQNCRIISLEASAIEFNCQHKMDFNEWIYKGITYCNKEQFEKHREKIKPKENQENQAPEEDITKQQQHITLSKESDKEFIAAEVARLLEWLADSTRAAETTFVCTDANSFLRRALREHISLLPQCCGLIVQSTPKKDNIYKMDMIVLRLSEQEKAERRERQEQESIVEFEQKTGVTRLFQAILEHQIPLIGHNCLFDILFMLHSFDHLPVAYSDFKSYLHTKMPVLYDTKYLVSTDTYRKAIMQTVSKVEQTAATADGKIDESQLQKVVARFTEGTHLGELYSVLQKEEAQAKQAHETSMQAEQTHFRPLISFAPGFERYKPNESGAEPECAHEAGYDACMTGFVFLHLHAQKSLLDFQTNGLCNKINIFRSLYRINLAGDDELVNEDQVLVYVKDFNAEWNNQSIQAWFEDLQQKDANKPLRVQWIDGTQLLVVFDKSFEPHIQEWIETTCQQKKIQLDEPQLIVLTWDQFVAEQNALYQERRDQEAQQAIERNNNAQPSKKRGRNSLKR